MKSEIAILDFGSQYTHLITRRIRELGVKAHIYPTNTSATKLGSAFGLILSGGPRSLIKEPHIKFDKNIFNLQVPILGLCYGHQLLADYFGGDVKSDRAREYGLAEIKISDSPIFLKLPLKTSVWMSHGDHVDKLPKGFQQIAMTDNRSIAAMQNLEQRIYGFQFHPEVTHTEFGQKMLSNFVFNICRAQKNWTNKSMLAELIKQIKIDAGSKKVFQLISGGVDSAVSFALLQKALGSKRVAGLYIDNGFMRLQETGAIKRAFTKAGFNNITFYDASEFFLKNVSDIIDPEKKRHIIGDTFLNIADEIMRKNGLSNRDWLLGQGTIYPDTIESGGTKNSDLIKTHHNRVPRVQKMISAGLIIEPIKELYKDEVRLIGQQLGLPTTLINRHPFPGPGLAIRVLCNQGTTAKPTRLNWPDKKIQLFKLPIQSVGVQGDERSYAHPGVIVCSKNIAWEKLRILAPQITNQIKGINRVLILSAGNAKNFLTATPHSAYLTKNRLGILRQLDALVNDIIKKYYSKNNIWQMPIVLLPFGNSTGNSLVLRPVESKEAMTVSFAALPNKILKKITSAVLKTALVDFIFYDITNKPPGTIEWE